MRGGDPLKFGGRSSPLPWGHPIWRGLKADPVVALQPGPIVGMSGFHGMWDMAIGTDIYLAGIAAIVGCGLLWFLLSS